MSLNISSFFSTFKTSAGALSNEKRQLAITAENIANAETTRTVDGKVYRRKQLVRENVSHRRPFSHELKNASLKLKTSNASHLNDTGFSTQRTEQSGSSLVRTNVEEGDQFREIYDPEHPDANEDGMVQYPDINVVTEMLHLISASRSYEANITVMGATKSMARKSLEI